LKLNSTHKLLVYANDVNILYGSIHTIKKSTNILGVASTEVGLEVNAERIKYMAISRDQNTGQNHNIKIDNKSFERVDQLKYFGTSLMKQNSIQEKIKIRLKSGNACYKLVQNPLSSHLLSKNIKMKIYRRIILLVVLYGCETWSLTLGKESRLRVFENRVLRRIFGPRREEAMGSGEDYIIISYHLFSFRGSIQDYKIHMHIETVIFA
jgi:hypothetical protein